MINENWHPIYSSVLGSLARSGPKRLQTRLDIEAEGYGLDVSFAATLQRMREAGPNDPVKRELSLLLAIWDDQDESSEWAANTPNRTLQRREAIYEELGVPQEGRQALTEVFPIKVDRNIIISDEFEPWYSNERQLANAFYWPAYQQHLLHVSGWAPESVADLDSATSDVVRRLSDPTRNEAFQAKGLVVGYVQSGKTANINGVIAKAIDAGYRLIIVMTGTIDLLREQTQRRIDMEVVGKENILRNVDPHDLDLTASIDYVQDDPDWDRFLSHGFLPSSQNFPDIIRLTNHRFAGRTGDYRSLLAGITALEFEKYDNTLPLNHLSNLNHCSARLVVVKKNKTVLKRLVNDLRNISPKLGEIPALVIDDESDNASVNTSNPRRWRNGERERTAINGLISQLLRLLPRAQYVGYTATPFANVFIDPQDSEDIFPRDFIIALLRPKGYMGASDFHDLDPTTDENELLIASPNERAHVRNLVASRDDVEARASELREALGMFILTGAIKQYRMANGYGEYRHHTMLVHESVRKDHHRMLAEEINGIWNNTSFSSPSGLDILRHLWLEDVIPTWEILAQEVAPRSFDDLKPYIGLALSAITDAGNPVVVVNSDRDIESEDVDFDKRPVWRILVGGAKLSRGFTVEGLTISYYRRRTGSGDTLMQMGRWFGFRRGYQDLVRLYIDREVQSGRRTVDLYGAFGAIMRAEELFREELAKYAVWVDGKAQIKPAQIPPLVTQHLPWLRPTAPNKMFNARLHRRRMDTIEPVAYPNVAEDIEANYDVMSPLVIAVQDSGQFHYPSGSMMMRYGAIPHSELLGALQRLRWCVGDHFAADLAYVEEMSHSVRDWLLLLPQRRRGPNCVFPELGDGCVFYRKRSRDPLFQAISDPKHRFAALRIAGVPVDRLYEDPLADELSVANRGALLVYPMVEYEVPEYPQSIDTAKDECIFGMHIVPPYSLRRRDMPYVEFQVQNLALADEVIVPGPGNEG